MSEIKAKLKPFIIILIVLIVLVAGAGEDEMVV